MGSFDFFDGGAGAVGAMAKETAAMLALEMTTR
jgi:hypothetical protein